jgi:hypothetical protein
MLLIYGEKDYAFTWLREEINKSLKMWKKVALWLAPLNTFTDLDDFREQRDSGSCY